MIIFKQTLHSLSQKIVKMKRSVILLLVNILLFSTLYSQPKYFSLNDETDQPVSLRSSVAIKNFDVSIKNARPFVLNPMVRNHNNVTVGDTLLLALFPEKEYPSVIQSKTTDVNGITTLTARLTDFRFAYCFISISNQAVLLNIDIPERKENYTTRFHHQKTQQYLIQLDENNLDILKDGNMSIKSKDSLIKSQLPKDITNPVNVNKENATGSESAKLGFTPEDSAQVDILVLYTPAAKEWADTHQGSINNTIGISIANCNLVSENSKLGINFHLVHSTEVDYNESGDSYSDLDNLTDGGIPNVHGIRDALAADVVLLLTTNNDFGGIAWLLYDKYGIKDYAYTVVRVQQSSGLSTIHEIGHNFGAHHPKQQIYEPGPTFWSNWPENTWSAGWRWIGDDNNYYCTVMGYQDGWVYPDGNSNTWVPYFSDPDISFQRHPVGDIADGNNARTIREMKHVVAGYREAIHQITPTLYTESVHTITADMVVSGGFIADMGDTLVTARGVVWSTTPLPDLSNNYTVDGSGTGAFTSQISNLVLNNIYYVRAYATNSFGTAYGNQVAFIYNGGVTRDFVTLWQLPEEQTTLELALVTSGEANYTWETVPAEQNGSGILPKVYGVVQIPDLPAGKTIRLSISPDNLKRFFTTQPYNPTVDIADKENLLDVEQWGTAQWNSMKFAFSGCKNLNISAIDIPDLSKVSNMSYMFGFCYALTGPANISNWYVGSANNMNALFCYATTFDQDLSGWDVSNVKDMTAMFQGARVFNQDISKWDVSGVTLMDQMFNDTKAFNQDIGSWDVSKVTSMNTMFGWASTFNQNIGGWNVSNVTGMFSMFYGAPAFNQDIGSWDVSKVSNMCQMFCDASSFNQDIGNWDVSNVTTMVSMFNNDTIFNQNIGRWDVSKVTNMYYMFAFAKYFNQDIGSWNVSNVTDMEAMFLLNSNFNQDIGGWNVSNVKTMSSMFRSATNFNQNNSGWDVSKVTNMSGMFNGASTFNQNIGNWNVSSVTDMSSMFCFTDSLNQDLSRWDVSKVTNMRGMFYNATIFNQDIGKWNTSKVTNMGNMFTQTSAFNQDLSEWDVSSVDKMPFMFEKAEAFNQDIGNWDVSKVTDMSGMLNYAGAFNQDIGKWNLSGSPNMVNMLDYCAIDSKNYSATLKGWSTNVNTPNSLALGAAGMQYECSAVDARTILTSDKNWTINGDRPISIVTLSGEISGETNVNPGQKSVTYTVPEMGNAISYTWTLPTGATGVSTSNNIVVDFNSDATSGFITVAGIDFCGQGTETSLYITVKRLPFPAGVIEGNTTVCQGQTSVLYISGVIDYATSYSWTLPTGATGTSTVRSIMVDFGTSAVSGNLSVRGRTESGDGVESSLAITVNPLPVDADIISGISIVYQGQNSVNYTVPSIANATSYIWTLPDGATGTSETNSLMVNYSSSAISGNITVKGHNDCGNGTASLLAITVNSSIKHDIPLNPGWNIISTNVIPSNLDLKVIFQSLIYTGKLIKVIDEAGKTIEDFGILGGWKNHIGNLNSSKGYKVYVTEECTLSVEGVPVPLPYNINLISGWNIISYPCTISQNAKAIVQPLIDEDKLIKVMDEGGKTIENYITFGDWINNIGNFIPGKGYKVYTNSSCTLTIPETEYK